MTTHHWLDEEDRPQDPGKAYVEWLYEEGKGHVGYEVKVGDRSLAKFYMAEGGMVRDSILNAQAIVAVQKAHHFAEGYNAQ